MVNERKRERKTNHRRLLGGYWMYRVVAAVELFSSGLSSRINILSAVIRESRLCLERQYLKICVGVRMVSDVRVIAYVE